MEQPPISGTAEKSNEDRRLARMLAAAIAAGIVVMPESAGAYTIPDSVDLNSPKIQAIMRQGLKEPRRLPSLDTICNISANQDLDFCVEWKKGQGGGEEEARPGQSFHQERRR